MNSFSNPFNMPVISEPVSVAQPKKKAKITQQQKSDFQANRIVQNKFTGIDKSSLRQNTKREKTGASGKRQNFNFK